MSQTSRDEDNSRRVRTHEKNSGETVRRLGTIIQSIFCAQFCSKLPLHEKLELHKLTRCKYGANKGEIKSKDGKYRICLPVYMGV